jgi:DNA-binding transcriptional LysR family regulator
MPEAHREMDTRLLRSFVMVAEELHFGRAAERAHLAQPALSRQIKRLEDELGAQLFVRDRRKVVLTEAGRAYLKEARAILERVDLAQQVVRRAGRGEVGSLSFGYEESTLYSIFPGVVRLYRDRFPGVVLELREMCTADQEEALLEGGIDVGLVQEPVHANGLRVETVLEEPLVAALPAQHPLVDVPKVELEDLAEDPFVIFPRWTRPGCYDLLTGLCRDAGYVPNVVLESASKQSLVGLVAASIGVALLNTSVSRLQRPGLVYKDILQSNAVVNTALAWRPQHETPVLRGFLGVAREASS